MENVLGVLALLALCYGVAKFRDYIRDRADQARSERERAQGDHNAGFGA